MLADVAEGQGGTVVEVDGDGDIKVPHSSIYNYNRKMFRSVSLCVAGQIVFCDSSRRHARCFLMARLRRVGTCG